MIDRKKDFGFTPVACCEFYWGTMASFGFAIQPQFKFLRDIGIGFAAGGFIIGSCGYYDSFSDDALYLEMEYQETIITDITGNDPTTLPYAPSSLVNSYQFSICPVRIEHSSSDYHQFSRYKFVVFDPLELDSFSWSIQRVRQRYQYVDGLLHRTLKLYKCDLTNEIFLDYVGSSLDQTKEWNKICQDIEYN